MPSSLLQNAKRWLLLSLLSFTERRGCWPMSKVLCVMCGAIIEQDNVRWIEGISFHVLQERTVSKFVWLIHGLMTVRFPNWMSDWRAYPCFQEPRSHSRYLPADIQIGFGVYLRILWNHFAKKPHGNSNCFFFLFLYPLWERRHIFLWKDLTCG